MSMSQPILSRERSYRSSRDVKQSRGRPRYMRPTADSSTRKQTTKPPPSSTISSSLSPSSSPLPPLPSPLRIVPTTNPARTAQLWTKVMAHSGDTESSKGKRREKISSSGSMTSKSASTSASGQRWRQTPPTSEAASIRTKKETAAKVTDADFMDAVLEPYGIIILNKGVNKDLRKHFRIQELPSDPKHRLDVYKEALPLDVWLDPDAGHIQREYKAMRVYECNEAEHSAYALRDIFLDGPLHPWLPEEDSDQRWLPVRMLQLVRKLPQDEWVAPPLVGSFGKRYGWDIRPDCAYHVSLQAFQPGFRPSVRKHVSVAQKRAFCSYLTIEFKRDEETLAVARQQVAVASAMALYNRYRLKSCALQMTGEDWTEEDKERMRHYGITFTGSTWDLWCTVPTSFSTWTGCNMSTIYSGDCCILAGVQQLTSAINDIHYWGLMVHGKSCKADIAAKVHSDPDADMNDITLLQED